MAKATGGVVSKVLGVTAAYEHGSKAYYQFQDGNYTGAAINTLKTGIDIFFIFAKASNPFVFFGSLVYTVVDVETSNYYRVMKFLTYLFYRLIKYYSSRERNRTVQNVYAFINIGALIMFNCLTIVFFSQTIFKVKLARYFFGDDPIINRFVVIPLIISPIFIILFFVYKTKKKEINIRLKEFNTIEGEERGKLNRNFWLYIVGTGVLFFASIASPAIVRLF